MVVYTQLCNGHSFGRCVGQRTEGGIGGFDGPIGVALCSGIVRDSQGPQDLVRVTLHVTLRALAIGTL